MREILFRGKQVDNGEWVYGYLTKQRHSPKDPMYSPPYLLEYVIDHEEKGIMLTTFVLPETVGQYTGLLDKNGKRIFEGDIVTDRYANDYTPIFKNGIYMAYNPKDIKLKKAEPSTQFNIIWKDGCEIIGKIHDNPELLKEE